MECSRGLKNIVLREYQMQALFWMLQRERGVVDERLKTEQAAASGDSNLWERHPFTDGTCFYFCPMFRMATLENPNELYRMCGGIIADEMGLGKTITMLSLLLVNRSKEDEVVSVLKGSSVSGDGVESSNMVKDSDSVENNDTIKDSDTLKNRDTAENNTKRNTTHHRLTEEGSELTPSLIVPKKNKGGTLIICPLSLLYTVHPINSHSPPVASRNHHPRGGGRARLLRVPQRLLLRDRHRPQAQAPALHARLRRGAHDVRLVRGGVRERRQTGELAVRDAVEAHRDRRGAHHQEREVGLGTGPNCRTRVHKAIVSLRGSIHWVVSGTPLQNTVNDLFSLFRFLHYEPWCYVSVRVGGHPQRHVWNSVFETRAAAKKEESEEQGDIHINMEIDSVMNLNRLRVADRLATHS